MFKAGDKVRVLRHRNFHGNVFENYGIPPGTVVTLKERDEDVDADGFVMFSVEDIGDGWSWLVRSDDIELVNEGPVREVTRREIVPGTYGRVHVGEDGYVGLTSCDFQHGTYMTADELREAAHILNQIAEALSDA